MHAKHTLQVEVFLQFVGDKRMYPCRMIPKSFSLYCFFFRNVREFGDNGAITLKLPFSINKKLERTNGNGNQ